jgi:cyanate permease
MELMVPPAPEPPKLPFRVQVRQYASDLKKVMMDKAFVLVALAGGISSGIYVGWSGHLASILMPIGYSQNDVAWIGMFSPLAAMIGGVAVGKIAGLLRNRHKFLIVTLFILTMVAFALFMLAVRFMLQSDLFRTSANTWFCADVLSHYVL